MLPDQMHVIIIIMFSNNDDEIPELLPIEESEKPASEPNTTKLVNASARRVPLTIICGFLGAGKSTLLRRILTERHGYRIAVIMNEFGDTADIEAKSITVDGESTTLELANGCLCCSIKDSGAAAIEKLMQRQGAFDHILLETTAGMFWHNEEYIDAQSIGSENGIVLDGDHVSEPSENGGVDSKGPGESLRQIAGSDVIVLNKVDLVEPSTLADTEAAIKHVNAIAPIYRTVRAELDLSLILGIQAYSTGKHLHSSSSIDQIQRHDHDPFDVHEHPPPSSQVPHYVTRGISSLQISLPPLTPSQFVAFDVWIRTLLWEGRLVDGTYNPSELDDGVEIQVLRCKGLLVLTNGEQRVLQGVRSMYEILAVEDDDQNAKAEFTHAGKVVLIGKGLGNVVQRSLLSAVGSLNVMN
ncbi:CobW/HypB/UreG, nucleotide-binding domain-containing protein [Rhodocollybia butyracea]|uniref:CobW/HypB/UreG, nucleotide-binding domain-containing protein n=1 Tax=Rhodocollybia butyracea TaxID=206335 RepID=A0A9P5P4L4_9AGAR|nr:CobW/HypB/UreG, nucleotide-binding domain-containing protein [Rhodocollybia butyracea]